MSEKDLLQVQLGKEVTWGTSVAGTAKLMTVTDVSLEPIVEQIVHKTMRGALAPGYLANVRRIAGQGTLQSLVDYEDLPYYLDSLFGVATPGGAGPYTRDYVAPVTAGSKPTPRLNTVIYGDSTGGVYKLEGGLVTKLAIKGESNQPLTLQADLIGKDVVTGALAALSDRTVNVAMGADVSLYLDIWAGTMGATAVAATFFAFELTLDSKMTTRDYMGALTPGAYTQPAWEGNLKLTLEFNATSKAYLDALLAVTVGAPFQRQVRIKATRDAGASEKLAQFDFAGTAPNSPKVWTDRDGVCTAELELAGTYNSGAFANWCKVATKNGVATLP
jgi:hypothetical protein